MKIFKKVIFLRIRADETIIDKIIDFRPKNPRRAPLENGVPD